MKILLEWLRDYADFDVPVEKLAEDLSLAGVAVEAVEDAPNGAGTVLELEITTNRPDLLGHIGVAREVAALYGGKVKIPAPKLKESKAKSGAAAAISIEITVPELCHRFTARVIRGVKVQPSPGWLKKRLEACGVQSISNIVDISNYVMLEMDYPNHIFDLGKVRGGQLRIRTADEGEKLRTLDGATHTLKAGQIVIEDSERIVSLAGVMGGEGTEVSSATKDVLVEAAWWDPVTIRRTERALGIRTEAGHRFERGMDVEAPPAVTARCAELILDLAGGELLQGAIDVYPTKWQRPQITLRRPQIARHLGAPVPDKDVEHILSSLGFEVGADEAGWSVTAPPWRRDVFREIDLIEEVARLHGYDKFPSTIPAARTPATRPPYAAARDKMRRRLEGMGFDEAISLSLVNPDEAEAFKAGGELVPIANPLSRENSALRPTGYLSLVKAMARNINRGQRNLRFYEIGKGYSPDGDKVGEHRILTLAMTGELREASVQEQARPSSLFALVGVTDSVLSLFDLPTLEHDASSLPWLALGEQMFIKADGIGLCEVGKLSPELTQRFKLRQDAWLAEFDLETLYAAGLRKAAHRPLSRFQAVERDYSLLVDDGVPFGEVMAAVEGLKIPELESVRAVDRFTGKSVPKGKYSLLLRVTFQSPDRTLQEEDIRGFTNKIVRALEEKTGATLRT